MQELLYRQTASKMFAVCVRYAKSNMEAEDIMQNAYLKVFEKIKAFRSDGSLEGWIRRIMVNTAIESYRKNSKDAYLSPIDENITESVGQIDYQRLEMQDLMKLIQNLAEGYRIVFNMYAIEGYSHKEIAENLGISEGASKSQLSRARAILQKEIIKMEGASYETYAR